MAGDDLYSPQASSGTEDSADARDRAGGDASGQHEEAARFAHDFKAPLRQSLLYQELLAGAGDLNQRQRELHDKSVTALKRLMQLIDQAVATHDQDAEVCCPADVLEQVRGLLQAELEENGAVIEVVDLPERLPLAAVDGVRLLQNLVHNALRYRSAAPPLIRVSGCCDGAVLRLEVADNGIGIDADRLANIFKSGETGRYGRRRGGSGMGLAVCRSIVRAAGGDIWASSDKDRGTTIHIALPSPR